MTRESPAALPAWTVAVRRWRPLKGPGRRCGAGATLLLKLQAEALLTRTEALVWVGYKTERRPSRARVYRVGPREPDVYFETEAGEQRCESFEFVL
jgi:hypothetical protein